jgi:hypothetical protein
MTPAELLTGIIRPVLSYLWTEHRVPNGPGAEAMMLAIAMQEGRIGGTFHRDQVVEGKPPGQVGPATGLWQCERGGGVVGVMQHASSAAIAQRVVEAAGVAWDRDAIWRAFTKPEGDQLAAAFARLLLFTDAAALPPATMEAGPLAFQYYLRNWRPGAWTRGNEAQRAAIGAKWGRNWGEALGVVNANDAPAPPASPVPAPDSLAARVAALEARLDRMTAALAK